MSGTTTTATTGLIRLTSTTAPNKVFGSREELAEHYKSDWHKYNCKRKEAGLPLLGESEFQARLEAALALKRERDAKSLHTGTSHLKKGKERKNSNVSSNNNNNGSSTSQSTSSVAVKSGLAQESGDMDTEGKVEEKELDEVEEEEEEAPPTIDPCQSLFDSKCFTNVTDNVKYMQHKYGFFIPDAEYLVDMKKLIGYCHEKIIIGQICLYCQRGFRSPRSTRDHMIDSQHAKIRYEDGIDLWEYEPFYDFTKANEEFWNTWNGGSGSNTNNNKSTTIKNKRKKKQQKKKNTKLEGETEIIVVEGENDDEQMGEAGSGNDDDSTEWEDVTDDEEEDGDNREMEVDDDKSQEEEDDMSDDDSKYDEYISQHGFDVTPYGELILPDGRIIGHRALSKYYKQKLPPPGERAAVRAARLAAAEANGYSSYLEDGTLSYNDKTPVTGRHILQRKLPRDQQGVLVRASTTNGGDSGGGNNNGGGFTTLSLYRHQALIKKSRREEAKSRRRQQRTTLPMNKMDKKGNRLMNNVSVAHAPR